MKLQWARLQPGTYQLPGDRVGAVARKGAYPEVRRRITRRRHLDAPARICHIPPRKQRLAYGANTIGGMPAALRMEPEPPGLVTMRPGSGWPMAMTEALASGCWVRNGQDASAATDDHAP
jgi:hypothetical protein